MYLSENFTLEELLASQVAERHGIDNRPPPGPVFTNLVLLCQHLERVRDLLGGRPMLITSGYRCRALNTLIGGSRHSAHMAGRAADFICPQFGPPRDICERIAIDDRDFDQLIYEGSWVHLAIDRDYPRREVLTAQFRDGGVTYSEGLA